MSSSWPFVVGLALESSCLLLRGGLWLAGWPLSCDRSGSRFNYEPARDPLGTIYVLQPFAARLARSAEADWWRRSRSWSWLATRSQPAACSSSAPSLTAPATTSKARFLYQAPPADAHPARRGERTAGRSWQLFAGSLNFPLADSNLVSHSSHARPLGAKLATAAEALDAHRRAERVQQVAAGGGAAAGRLLHDAGGRSERCGAATAPAQSCSGNRQQLAAGAPAGPGHFRGRRGTCARR